MCALVKGRFSSHALRRLLRQACALMGFLGIKLHVVWIPTDENPAGGPSRGRSLWESMGPSGLLPWPQGIMKFVESFRVLPGGLISIFSETGSLALAFIRHGLATAPELHLPNPATWGSLARSLECVRPAHIFVHLCGRSWWHGPDQDRSLLGLQNSRSLSCLDGLGHKGVCDMEEFVEDNRKAYLAKEIWDYAGLLLQ